MLPAIQREFVWHTDQIERLFDSLMRDYPIGSFLFWYVEKQNLGNFQFYEFIKDYHERDKRHNPKADIKGDENVTAILDGQQRLGALYIGLKGKYAYKLPRRRWNDNSAFPERELYLNLLKEPDEHDMEYDFRFLTEDDAECGNENTYWFKVGNILDLKEEHEVNNYMIKNKLLYLGEGESQFAKQFANKSLFKLHRVIHNNPIINYYLEKDEKLNKVLNIFIRVNSGGTKLSYSDLLLSVAIAEWKGKDAREEITKFVDEINHIGDGFSFDKDFVLKSCLVLSDFSDIAFMVDNFSTDNMLKVEKNWDRISEAVRLAVALIAGYGYNRDTLTSNYAIIPISYYLLKRDLPSNFVQSSSYTDDRKRIHKWLIFALLKRVFSGQPDNVLRLIRVILSQYNLSFPLDEIIENFRGTAKPLIFNDDEVENLFFYRYGERYTFSTLALLYPSLDFRNKFHVDHIFPKSFFTKTKLNKKGIEESKIKFYLDNFNYLANLQLLEGIPNQEKSDTDFGEWLYKSCPNEQDRKDYMNKHYIPDTDMSFNNFENFIIERKKLMLSKFRSILKL